jgi:VWFA-related protein
MAVATVRPQEPIKVDVRLVDVYASVYDSHGNPVDGLTQDRFQVLDDGVAQKIKSFEAISGDLTCAILLDTTGSMRDSLGAVKNGIVSLLDEMRPNDSAALFGFSTGVEKLQDFTTDKAVVKRAVLRTRAGGETALFDSIVEVAGELSEKQGKKALVLFTDGADNASRLVADSAIRKALRAGVPIYAVAEGDALHESKLLVQLQSLAEKTGGICYRAKNPKDVTRVFADIQAELKHLYMLTYTPPPNPDRTKWRTIQIQVGNGKEFRVRGKQGYFPN